MKENLQSWKSPQSLSESLKFRQEAHIKKVVDFNKLYYTTQIGQRNNSGTIIIDTGQKFQWRIQGKMKENLQNHGDLTAEELLSLGFPAIKGRIILITSSQLISQQSVEIISSLHTVRLDPLFIKNLWDLIPHINSVLITIGSTIKPIINQTVQ